MLYYLWLVALSGNIMSAEGRYILKCYCSETNTELIFCVQDVDSIYEQNLQDAWFKKSDDKYVKRYPAELDEGVSAYDIECVKRNFSQLGPSMFENISDWTNDLLLLAKTFADNEIEWYVIGSISEAVLGVDIIPHDIDIVVHTRDFYKVKDIFSDCVVEPFVDNKGTWLVRYFGRLCLSKGYIDVAADEKMNLGNHQYTNVHWNGYNLFIEPLQIRYETEVQRNRMNRIRAIEKYMNRT